MTTLREAAQQALEALESISDCYVGDDDDAGECASCHERSYKPHAPDCKKQNAITALRAALAQPEPRNQCGETCERAKLCAVCARGLQQTQTPCDIAEDGVCEAIDCCRKLPQILEALEIGYDSAQAEAAQYHAAMAGYRPERHAEMDADVQKIAKAITAVKAALAQAEQEPVAWASKRELARIEDFDSTIYANGDFDGAVPLYTHPPRREWQSLTDTDIARVFRAVYGGARFGPSEKEFAIAVESLIKEKNHD
jgi:hypothetical protein